MSKASPFCQKPGIAMSAMWLAPPQGTHGSWAQTVVTRCDKELVGRWETEEGRSCLHQAGRQGRHTQ
jgi:hypothetical protein